MQLLNGHSFTLPSKYVSLCLSGLSVAFRPHQRSHTQCCDFRTSQRSKCRESVSVECSTIKDHLYHTSLPQTSENLMEDRTEVREKWGEPASSVFNSSCTHELTAAVVAHKTPSWGQASQHPSMEQGRAHTHQKKMRKKWRGNLNEMYSIGNIRQKTWNWKEMEVSSEGLLMAVTAEELVIFKVAAPGSCAPGDGS